MAAATLESVPANPLDALCAAAFAHFGEAAAHPENALLTYRHAGHMSDLVGPLVSLEGAAALKMPLTSDAHNLFGVAVVALCAAVSYLVLAPTALAVEMPQAGVVKGALHTEWPASLLAETLHPDVVLGAKSAETGPVVQLALP